MRRGIAIGLVIVLLLGMGCFAEGSNTVEPLAFSLRNGVLFGMSPDDVKQIEKENEVKLGQKTGYGNRAYTTDDNIAIAGYLGSRVEYYFERGQLDRVEIHIQPDGLFSWSSYTELTKAFQEIESALEKYDVNCIDLPFFPRIDSITVSMHDNKTNKSHGRTHRMVHTTDGYVYIEHFAIDCVEAGLGVPFYYHIVVYKHFTDAAFDSLMDSWNAKVEAEENERKQVEEGKKNAGDDL